MIHHQAADETVLGDDVEPVSAQLAEEIRRRRKAADLSHAQLAVKVGYSREYVRRAESLRKGLPWVDLVRALDNILGEDGSLLALRAQAEAARRARRRRYRRLPGAGHADIGPDHGGRCPRPRLGHRWQRIRRARGSGAASPIRRRGHDHSQAQ
jgi:transcriptional regulator with XRE-family HTH domain